MHAASIIINTVCIIKSCEHKAQAQSVHSRQWSEMEKEGDITWSWDP